MSRSTYSYNICTTQGINFILIVDKNVGMSVTNDIENVIEEIALKEKIDLDIYNVLYQDSTGKWDGFDYKNGRFFFLGASTADEAVEQFLNLKNEE